MTVIASPAGAQDAWTTPASVSVVEGETLRAGQLRINLSETLARVPGLQINNRHNAAQDLQIASRGYGARASFGVRGLRLLADGIPAAGPDGQGQVSHFDLASARQVEVLRGPFSALYGASAGGVIAIETEDGGPATELRSGAAAGSHGVGRLDAQAGGAGQVAGLGAWGAVRWRLAASGWQTDGPRDHSAARRTGFNGKLRLGATGEGGPGGSLTLVVNQVRLPGAQDPLGLTRAEWEADPSRATAVATQFDTRKRVTQTQAGAVLAQPLGAGHSLRIAAYAGERQTDQVLAIPVATQAPPSHPGGVIDLARRYHGLDARWVWRPAPGTTLTLGAATDQLAEQRRGYQNFTGGLPPVLGQAGALRRDERNTAGNADAYAQLQWQPAPRWRATLGARHTRVQVRSQDRYVAPGNADDSGATDVAATLPVAGLLWQASPTLNLYASYGHGFEVPTLNELAYRADGSAGLNLALRPAASRQWELGAKARLGELWRAELAWFSARTSDEIVVSGNSGGRASYQNASGTRRRGVELAARGEWDSPAGRWRAELAATWLDARYTQGFLTCAGAPCTTPSVLVAAGNRLPGVARHSAFAELAWRHLASGTELALNWRHSGRVPVDDAGSDHAPAYRVLGAAVQWRQRLPGGWQLGEFVRVENLTDRRHAGSVIVGEGNRRFFEPAPGRTWLVGVDLRRVFD